MNRSDIEIVQEKLASLQSYYKELADMQGITLEEYSSNYLYKRTAERLIQLIIEVATDINNMIIKALGKETPSDYYTSFIKVAEAGVFPINFALEISPSTGLRNIIVHEYQKIEDDIVHASIKKTLDYYLKYMNYVSHYMDSFSAD